MRNGRWHLASISPILSLGAVLLCSTLALSQIKPYSENPSYWQYNGTPILLFGASETDNIFQWAGEGSKLIDHLDLLAGCGGNYIRCTMSSRSYSHEGHHWDRRPYPFAKVNGKYDLTKWDAVYWNKLRTFLAETRRRDIIVQLEFWDRWNEAGDSDIRRTGWYDSPWNPNNNTTYDWKDSRLLTPGKTDFYNAFHYAAVEDDSVLLPLQRRFVRKVIDEVMEPHNDLLTGRADDEAYCLAEPGKQYAVFFTGKSDRLVKLDLPSAAPELRLRWLDVARSRWGNEGSKVRGTMYALRPPDESQWVAVLSLYQ